MTPLYASQCDLSSNVPYMEKAVERGQTPLQTEDLDVANE
jgi:hypothetical protein